MDRVYYQLVDEGAEIVRLSNAVVRNADYNPACKAATDNLALDALKSLQQCKRVLEELIKRQFQAYDTSKSA